MRAPDDPAWDMPVNVRVVLPGSDQEFPVDCVFMGINAKEYAIWQVTATLPVDLRRFEGQELTILADSIPPHCEIQFNLNPGQS